MESGIEKGSKRRLDARVRAYADEADFRRFFSYEYIVFGEGYSIKLKLIRGKEFLIYWALSIG